MVTRDVFQVLKLHSPAARAILRTFKTSLVPIYHVMHSRSYDFLYIPMSYLCIPLYTPVYPSIPLLTLVCPVIPMYTFLYHCIPLYTLVYPCILLLTLVYPAIPTYTFFIPLYTPVYPCIPLYTLVYPCIPLLTLVYPGIPWYNKRKFARLITQYSIGIYFFQYLGRHGLPSSGCYRVISLANFRLLFNLLLIRSSTARGSGTSILLRWSLQELTSKEIPWYTYVIPMYTFVYLCIPLYTPVYPCLP